MNNLQERLGYKFKNINLLNEALTHISYSNENNVPSYERLEFLGDAVIELVVSDYIYNFEELDSGILSKLRASLVSTSNLSKISLELGLDKLVKKSKSLSVLSQKNQADLFESLIAAVYLDGGQALARELVYKYVIIDKHNTMQIMKNSVDFKTKLQEDMQANKNEFQYVLTKTFGQDHDKTFEVDLIINGENVSHGVGKSIHLAETTAAKNYYESLKN